MLDGAVWLSAKANAPILPVGIGGSERSMPKGSYIPKPAQNRYHLRRPIPAPQPKEGAKELADPSFENTQRNSMTLQGLFDEAQRKQDAQTRS